MSCHVYAGGQHISFTFSVSFCITHNNERTFHRKWTNKKMIVKTKRWNDTIETTSAMFYRMPCAMMWSLANKSNMSDTKENKGKLMCDICCLVHHIKMPAMKKREKRRWNLWQNWWIKFQVFCYFFTFAFLIACKTHFISIWFTLCHNHMLVTTDFRSQMHCCAHIASHLVLRLNESKQKDIQENWT